VSLEPDAAIRFAVVDVETTGLSATRDSVLQVGVVTIGSDGHVVDRWSSLVRPAHRWFFRIGPRHIHGIGRRELRAAPPAAQVLDQLTRRLDGAIVVAHNAAFDTAFLVRMAERSGRRLPLERALCTLALSRRLDPEHRMSHRLGDVCARYQVDLVRPHDALADADATAAVLLPLLEANGLTTVAQVQAQLVTA
jgi:DNA polymerase III alpha subunit (gram-positive type)